MVSPNNNALQDSFDVIVKLVTLLKTEEQQFYMYRGMDGRYKM